MNPSQVSSSKGKSTVSHEVTIEPDPQTIKLESSPTSVEFHPNIDNILLVDTDGSVVIIFDLLTSEQYFYKCFSIQNSFDCCAKYQDFETTRTIPVKKVTWSPSGSIFGIAFVEYFVHLYRQNVVDYFAFEFFKQGKMIHLSIPKGLIIRWSLQLLCIFLDQDDDLGESVSTVDAKTPAKTPILVHFDNLVND
ncbi:hypothetical protein PIB30_068019 [Stylosanthes scabra]|uniref:Uncharacterized protein n=1 Tax=Stylosanthes scabra TaxID=79078 RepID=A0ABU6YKB6_9FABA|nr:hypothetical protein [Stylosanthes scabra]